MQQVRLAVRDGIMEKHEARVKLGLAAEPADIPLSQKSMRQVYAVAAKAANRESQKKQDSENNPDLFTEES